MAESKPPRDLPQVPDSVDPAIRRPLSRVIEEVQRLLEFRGDPLDAALTLRKAIARGLVDSVGRGMTGDVTYINTFPTSTGGGSDEPDLTPPPGVTGLSVTAGFTQVLVRFDAPTYTVGHGNLQTNIYASRKNPADPAMPTFDDAVLVFSAPGALNVVSIPSEMNTRWHVWAKYRTVDGVESVNAAGGINGYNVAGEFPTTGQDIAQLLDVLTGQIRESHLYESLGARVNLIDAADTVVGSVSARVKAETDARAQAITLARSDFAAADAATLASANSYVTTYAYAKSTVDGALAAQNASIRADFATADASTLASANSFTYARSTIDSAIASSASAVSAAFAAADAATLASANAYTYSRATIDESIASSASTLTANYGSAISSAVSTEASARAALDGAVQALYTVRTEVSSGGRTVVGGFGLAATATADAGPRIDFGVRADTFFVEAPGGGGNPTTKLTPFTIRTSTFTEGGVTMPAGVYMDAAYVVNLTALHARIATLVADQITAASINVAQLVAGSLAVGAYAQSTGFVSGTSGWRISGNGNAEFSGVVVRGTIYAATGSIGGNTIDATGVQSPDFATGSAGWRLRSDGSVEFSNALIRGNSEFRGALNVQSSSSGPRLEITNSRIRVHDGTTYRLVIGDLS